MPLSVSTEIDSGGRHIVGPNNKLPGGTTNPGDSNYAAAHVIPYSSDYTTALANALGMFMQGPIAHDDAASTARPLHMGGVARSSPPTVVSNGDVVRAFFDLLGQLAVTLRGTDGTFLFPDAAALADGFSNPTVTKVGAMSMGWNGTTWDRLKSIAAALTTAPVGSAGAALFPDAAALADNMSNPTATRIGSHMLVWDGAAWDRWLSDAGAARTVLHDTGSNAVAVALAGADAMDNGNNKLETLASLMMFNGSTWDRLRGDTTNGVDVDVTRLPALSGATAVDAGTGTDDEAITGAAANLRLLGFTAKETTGTAGASFLFHNGDDTGDPATTAPIDLVPGESTREWFGEDGIASANGIYLERVSGDVRVVAYYRAG